MNISGRLNQIDNELSVSRQDAERPVAVPEEWCQMIFRGDPPPAFASRAEQRAWEEMAQMINSVPRVP